METTAKPQFLSTKKSKPSSPHKHTPKPIDQLNEWSYVNPANQGDELPQPYRAINKIIQEDLLKAVYQQIFDIEKYKSDPNYEGHLKSLPPQGSFDISHITCVCKESLQSHHNHVLAGDAYGNIMILDLNKKMRITKKEVGNGRRISQVAIGGRDLASDEQQTIQNVAVLAHLDTTVYIYRYRLGENKLFLHHTIVMGDKGELPVDVSFSIYSQFLQVVHYNGNITIYRIPDLSSPKITEDVPAPLTKQKTQVSINPTIIQSPKQNFFPDSKMSASHPQISSQTSHLEIKPTVLVDVFYKILFKGIKKELKYSEIIQNLRQEYQKPLAEVSNPVLPKDDKKKPAVGGKPDPKKVEEAPPAQVVSEEFEGNQTPPSIEHVKAEDGLDVSKHLPEPKYKPYCLFVCESVGLGQSAKAFNLLKKYDIVVGVVVTWSGSSSFHVHTFQSTSRYNLPEYLQLKITPPPLPDASDKSLTQIANAPQPKFEPTITSLKTIYPISVIAVSQSSAFLALGLLQGSIIIYDLSTSQEKYYLDKHQACVTHVLFCDDWKLVSGAHDGTIHIYDLLEAGKLMMKRTNQFRKKKTQVEQRGRPGIAFLGVSSSGVATALDYQHEIRLYDVWHGEKIGKLCAQQTMDDRKRVWSLWPKPVVLCAKSEIIIIADSFDQGATLEEIEHQQSSWTKSTCVQIYKIFDNLINLFPALSNVYRRGIDKEKIIHLYSKIDGVSLKDPSFEVPSLAGVNDIGKNQLAIPQHNKSATKSHRSQLMRDSKKMKSTSKSPTIGGTQDLTKIKEEDVSQIVSLVNSLHGSSISDSNQDFNSSFRSATRKSHKEGAPKISKNVVLTKQMLHPEQFLLEKEKVPVPKPLNENQKVIEHCRIRNADRMVRVERVNSLVTKLGNSLQLAEEKRILQEKQKLLQNTKTKKQK